MINLPNGLAFIETWLAVLKIGCIAVSVLQKVENLRYYFEDTKAKILVTTCDSSKLSLPIVPGLEYTTFVVHPTALESNPHVKSYEEMKYQSDSLVKVHTFSDTAATINYTSGILLYLL